MKQPFEMVIMQDSSTSALSDSERASFREKVAEFNAEIVKRGAKTALYMTHAHVKPSTFASPDMIRKVEDMYVSVGNEVGIFVIPVGLAFEEAYRQRPDIKLHKDYDGSHPDLMGTYLAASFGRPSTSTANLTETNFADSGVFLALSARAVVVTSRTPAPGTDAAPDQPDFRSRGVTAGRRLRSR